MAWHAGETRLFLRSRVSHLIRCCRSAAAAATLQHTTNRWNGDFQSTGSCIDKLPDTGQRLTQQLRCSWIHPSKIRLCMLGGPYLLPINTESMGDLAAVQQGNSFPTGVSMTLGYGFGQTIVGSRFTHRSSLQEAKRRWNIQASWSGNSFCNR